LDVRIQGIAHNKAPLFESRFLVRVRCKLWPLKANTLLTNIYNYNIK
jgi:hypothetical protein